MNWNMTELKQSSRGLETVSFFLSSPLFSVAWDSVEIEHLPLENDSQGQSVFILIQF